MAILTLLSESEAVVFVAAAVGGDEFPNDLGDSKLLVYNQSAAALRVVFVEQESCSYGAKNVHAESTVTIEPGDQAPVGKFTPIRYNNSYRRVECTYPDGVGGLFVAAALRP